MSGDETIPPSGPSVGLAETELGSSTLSGSGPSGPQPASLQAGTRVGRYVVIGRIGAGGMGEIHAAYDPELDRKVAIKLVHARVVTTEAAHVRLLREAQALARLAHPNVVAVHDVGTFAGRVFIAMELVAGVTLDRWLQLAPRTRREILPVFLEAGRGLAAAHAAGLVHRDFKPGNVIVGDDGRVRVLDLGLARAAEEAVATSAAAPAAADVPVSPLTQEGAFLGTPAYAAPEQLSGRAVDARADQFAFCVALYEALHGQRPFAGQTVPTLREAIEAGQVRPPPAGGRVPGWLRQILLRGLAATPSKRYPSLQLLLDDLSRDPSRLSRRIVAVGAGLLVVTGIAVGMRLLGARNVASCLDGLGRIEDSWSPARKQAIQAAFLASGRPYAPDTWRRLEPVLDGYASAWSAQAARACQERVSGGPPGEVLTLQLACVRRRLGGVQSLLEALARPTDLVLERAVPAARSLPSVEECADPRVLGSGTRAPTEPAQRSAVERARAALARAQELRNLGQYQQGLATVRPVVTTAQELGYRPLEAEALFQLGDLLDRVGDSGAGVQSLEKALWLGMSSGHDEVAARAATLLAYITGYIQLRADVGQRWASEAGALLDRIGARPELRAELHRNLGAVLKGAGKLEDAANELRQAIDGQEKALGADHPELVTSCSLLGDTQLAQGQAEKARESLRRASQIAERGLGASHPDVARVLVQLGSASIAEGRYDEARIDLERARGIFERALGAEHPNVASAIGNLGIVAYFQRRYPEARGHYGRARAIYERTRGPDHPEVANQVNNLGDVYLAEGRPREALAHYRQALSSYERTLGAVHAGTALVHSNVADALRALGSHSEAIAHYSRAVAIEEKALGPRHPELAVFLTGMGLCHLEQRQPRRALPLLERASELRTTGDPVHLATTSFALARALWETHSDPKRADRLSEAARKGLPADLALARGIDAWRRSRGLR